MECSIESCDRTAYSRAVPAALQASAPARRRLRRPPDRTGAARLLGRRLLPACRRARAVSRPYQRTHYKRAVKHGDVQNDVPIRVVTGEGWMSHGYWNVAVQPEFRHLTNGEAKIGEHRLVMAQYLGRALLPEETVHHRNGIRTDNRLENLELWSTAHGKGQRVTDKVAFAVEQLRRYAPELLYESHLL